MSRGVKQKACVSNATKACLLQNRRDLASLGLVSSTLTRFRQSSGSFGSAQVFSSRLPLGSPRSRLLSASTSKTARLSFAGAGEFDSHTPPPILGLLRLRSAFLQHA